MSGDKNSKARKQAAIQLKLLQFAESELRVMMTVERIRKKCAARDRRALKENAKILQSHIDAKAIETKQRTK